MNLLIPQVAGELQPKVDSRSVFKAISKLSARIRRKLRPYAVQELRSGKEELKAIIMSAVTLDLQFKKQRADFRLLVFSIRETNHQFGFNVFDAKMEDVHGGESDSNIVELVLAPALEKRGDSDGENFNQSTILLKADVTCNRITREHRGGRSKRVKKKTPFAFPWLRYS